MKKGKKCYQPCSDRDIRAGALKATHELLTAMDERGEPTVGKMGAILREQRTRFLSFGLELAKQGDSPRMTWEDWKKAIDAFHRALP